MLRGSLLLICLLAPMIGALPPVVAPVEACGTSCPCEQETAGDQATVEHREAPNDESCPEDCTDCRCGSRAVMALVSVPIAQLRQASSQHELLASADSVALGDAPGVFRPPRG